MSIYLVFIKILINGTEYFNVRVSFPNELFGEITQSLKKQSLILTSISKYYT